MQTTIISWTTQLLFFGSASISMDSISEMEQNAPNLILYALPFVAFFTLLEYVMFYFLEHKSHDHKETIGSVLIGIGNLTINTLLKTGMFYSIVLIYITLCPIVWNLAGGHLSPVLYYMIFVPIGAIGYRTIVGFSGQPMWYIIRQNSITLR